MPDEKRTVTLGEWHAEGKERFGGDPKQWKFICPGCGHVQSYQDFLDLGMEPKMAQGFVGFSCIGRWKGGVEFGEQDEGNGCIYAGGGLFRVNPVLVEYGGPEPAERFEWAPTQKEKTDDRGTGTGAGAREGSEVHGTP